MTLKIHESLTTEVLMEAAKRQMFGLDNPGFCIKCGFEQGGCEPDARKYPCEDGCGNYVYGAEELFMMFA